MDQMLHLFDLLQHEIDDLYAAEEQIIEALPNMIGKATNPKLKTALTQHLAVTRQQKERLERIRQMLTDGDARKEPGFLERIFGSKKCKGTEGLIKEGEHIMKQKMAPEVMDAAIIAAAQKIEHYEICGYGTARAFAMQLGLSKIEDLLKQTLDEEYDADDTLSELAFFDVNLDAQDVGSQYQKRRLN